MKYSLSLMHDGTGCCPFCKTFHDSVPLTGVILTQMDGDARGGAALSIIEVTNCPIKFIGTGEKFDALELFHPRRMADRF